MVTLSVCRLGFKFVVTITVRHWQSDSAGSHRDYHHHADRDPAAAAATAIIQGSQYHTSIVTVAAVTVA